MTTAHEDIIHAALESAGLEPDNWDGSHYAVPDNEGDEAEEYLAAINAALPADYRAEWDGSSDTDAEGYTTSDAVFFYRDERIKE